MIKKLSLSLLIAGLLAIVTSNSVHASTIDGNGAGSKNKISHYHSNFVLRKQSNYAHFDNDVKVENETGENKANGNTGGDVDVTSGPSETKVKVVNTANSNLIEDGCGCPTNEHEHEAVIKDNGAWSKNSIKWSDKNVLKEFQTNNAHIDNDVKVENETGENQASWNTGGNTTVESGGADTHVVIKNNANMNVIN